jgi:hypothetical protein
MRKLPAIAAAMPLAAKRQHPPAHQHKKGLLHVTMRLVRLTVTALQAKAATATAAVLKQIAVHLAAAALAGSTMAGLIMHSRCSSSCFREAAQQATPLMRPQCRMLQVQ